ncbi:hypothetical protein NLI96_g9496 [Meripilus lineatus]|uniref:Protein ROT1 n=1 Tax=Meripilus lineatus TaxID=2056292 RepID=A0AAD5V0K8_9APHY|nr:hypothetical protein NLI96_g9496 [Physisporinus lineatus]
MILFPFLSILLAALPVLSQDLSAAHNTTGLSGTWSSGSKNVLTGSVRFLLFFLPTNQSPLTFVTNSGFCQSKQPNFYLPQNNWRVLLLVSSLPFVLFYLSYDAFRTVPTMASTRLPDIALMATILPNNSIVLTPFPDGYQQIQDPCAAVSNFIESYTEPELYVIWQIFTDVVDGYKLHLFGFDGTPVAPQFRVGDPNMLPTQNLRNTTNTTSTLTSQQVLLVSANSGGESLWRSVGAGSLMTSLVSLGVASLLL